MNRILNILLGFCFLGPLIAGCAEQRPVPSQPAVPALTRIEQIDSFSPSQACRQAVDVVNNNPYDQVFFEKVFSRLVDQCENNKSPANADIIWSEFVVPLKSSGKAPPDLVVTTWNYYFSKYFFSLPSMESTVSHCSLLATIKGNIAKEYRLKKRGFEVCMQGNPDQHFLNAMYVYNTMWAVCHDAK